MTDIINIFFRTSPSQKYSGQLQADFTAADIKHLVREKLGSDHFQLTVSGQEIPDNDPVKFAELKKLIKDNTVIYVCQILNSSSDIINVDSLKSTILIDLEKELCKVSTPQTNFECMLCAEDKQCIKYCCNSILCKECFSQHFVHADYKVVCLKCNQTLPSERIFITPEFIQSLTLLDEIVALTRNIDFQICTCGTFSINRTLYAKQKCNYCQRWFCFFCNKDWDEVEKKMRNEKYTCKVNCFWEEQITYQLVQFEYNEQMQIPDRRCCPKCIKCGPYDNKCKFETCDCGHEFCFICLQPKLDCLRTYKSAYNRPCGDVAQQSFAIFPRLCRDQE